MVGGLKNVEAFWVSGLRQFWEGCARACIGEEGALEEVESGVGVFVSFARGGELERYGAETRGLMDDSRNVRESSGFKPRGDDILQSEYNCRGARHYTVL